MVVLLFPSPGIDEDIDSGSGTDDVEELNLLVVVMGIGIDDSGEQLGGKDLLGVAHALHHVDGYHAVEATSEREDLIADAILDTDGVEHGTLARVNIVVNIDHLNQQAHQRRLLSIGKINHCHVVSR